MTAPSPACGLSSLRVTPSSVAFTDTERFVGEAAENQAAANPANTVFDAKRLIGNKCDDPDVVVDLDRFPFNVCPDQDNKPLIKGACGLGLPAPCLGTPPEGRPRQLCLCQLPARQQTP